MTKPTSLPMPASDAEMASSAPDSERRAAPYSSCRDDRFGRGRCVLRLTCAVSTGIATPAGCLWADTVDNPNPFIAKRFGSPGNAWARLTPLLRGRIFLARTAPLTKAGIRLKRLSLLEDNGDQPWAVIHVLSPSGPVHRLPSRSLRFGLPYRSACRCLPVPSVHRPVLGRSATEQALSL